MTTLKPELRVLLMNARQQEGMPQRRSYESAPGRRLLLEITQLRSGDVQVSLERNAAEPPSGDWERLLAAWPEPVPDGVVPVRRKEGRRYLMVARWPRPVGSTANPAEKPEASA